jgi:hypothetical protein
MDDSGILRCRGGKKLSISQHWHIISDLGDRNSAIVDIDGRPLFTKVKVLEWSCLMNRLLIRIPIEYIDFIGGTLEDLYCPGRSRQDDDFVQVGSQPIVGRVEEINRSRGVVLSVKTNNLSEREVVRGRAFDMQAENDICKLRLASRELNRTCRNLESLDRNQQLLGFPGRRIMMEFDATAMPHSTRRDEDTASSRRAADSAYVRRMAEIRVQFDQLNVVIPPPLEIQLDGFTMSQISNFTMTSTPLEKVSSEVAISRGFTEPFCKYYVGSPYLMCSAKPHGPCQECGEFEVEGAPTNEPV